eukprot:15299-Heterococcus_DN1.PRE.2
MKLDITEAESTPSCAELKAQGNACFQLEDHSAAAALYSQAAAVADSESSRIACLNNLSYAYIKLGSMQQAETARVSAGRYALALEDCSTLLLLEPVNKEVQALASEAEAKLLENFDVDFISEAAALQAQPVSKATEIVHDPPSASAVAYHSEPALLACAVSALEPPARNFKVYSNGIHTAEASAYMIEGWKPPSIHATAVQQAITLQHCAQRAESSVAALVHQLKSSSLADTATTAAPQQLAPDSWQSLAAEESRRVCEARQKLLLVKDSVKGVSCQSSSSTVSSSSSSSSKLTNRSSNNSQPAVKAADAEWQAMLAAEAALKSRADATLRSKAAKAKQKRSGCRDTQSVHASVAEHTWAAMQAALQLEALRPKVQGCAEQSSKQSTEQR